MTAEAAVEVAIVGGGLAGLCLAYRLRQLAPERSCLLLEAGDRLGGKIVTERIATDEGAFVIEAGADAFLAQKPWGRELADDLGLGDRLIPINTMPRGVSVLHRGVPLDLPAGVSLIAPTEALPFLRSPIFSPLGKLRMAADLVLPRRARDGDESVAAFVTRRLGREAVDRLAEPMLAGIYNADPARMSLAATFPNFPAIERRDRSLIRGLRAARKARASAPPAPVFLTPRGGMGELTDALAAQVGDLARLNAPVDRISRRSDGRYELTAPDGEAMIASTVVLATPAATAADLLRPLAPAAATALAELRTHAAGSMALAYRTADIPRPLPGYGLVIPASERRPLNAITVASRKFDDRAPAGWTLLRCFFGGYRSPATMQLDDVELLTLVRAQLGELFGIAAEPAFHRITRWPAGSPQYDLGHRERIARIEAALPANLLVAGSPYRGVGVPDIAHDAAQLAARIATRKDLHA